MEKIEIARSSAEALGAELVEKIAKLQDGSRTPEYVSAETAKLKEMYLPGIEKAMGEAGTAAAGLELASNQWGNTDFVLSLRAVSPRENPHPAAPPKDATAEAMTRLMLMQQFGKMSDELLRLTAEDAKITGRQGVLFFVNSELADRGKSGVDLSDVVLEDQVQALSLLKRAEAGKQGAFLVWKTANSGRQPSPIEKINQARLEGAVE